MLIIGPMITAQAASKRVRSFVNERRHHWRLRTASKEYWNQLGAALDVIDDAANAIHAYRCSRRDVDVGERYLLTYGLLEALYVQQNAVQHLCEALDHCWKWKSEAVLMNIRDIRNSASGHPTRKGMQGQPPTFHGIVQTSMAHSGFELYSWDSKGNLTARHVV